MQYVKYISNVQVQEPPQNKDGIINYNLNVELLIEDGYKPLVPAIPPTEEEIRMYHFEYRNNSSNIEEIVIYDETEEEAQERIARLDKERKTQEINFKIEELEKMAQYDILYDNKENIQCYKDVISGLEETRDNL